MDMLNIDTLQLLLSYLLLAFPLGFILWYRIPIFSKTLIAIIRMTLQLIFVGFYLQFIFRYDNFWLNAAWLASMIIIADLAVINGSNLKVKKFILPMLAALITGTAIPLLTFMAVILKKDNILQAQYAIPIGGMILGNCLRANIIGIKTFYKNLRTDQPVYLSSLANGATLNEAVRPFIKEACQNAFAPTIASMATIGLVALPGMMTGVILAGADPLIAIKYQIAIMIAIFTGTAITVVAGIRLTMKSCFNNYGILNQNIFKK